MQRTYDVEEEEDASASAVVAGEESGDDASDVDVVDCDVVVVN